MPVVSPSKIIRDVVHGYIPLTQEDVEIIDTSHFQRLRHIKQTGAHSVYPSANHTRFEHSLGVMYLGARVLEVLEMEVSTELRATVRYACLLHDVGHAPFSHLGESFYDKSWLAEKVRQLLAGLGVTSTLKGNDAAAHELCSCAIALEKYSGVLVKLGVDLDLLCRMITGERYGSNDNKTENCLIGILNSTADVDKLDYILRDSFMSGSQLITLDVERLISAYKIHDNSLVFSGKAISTISNLVHGRNALYTWVYNHHITVYTDNILKRLLGHILERKEGTKEQLFSYEAVAERLVDDHDVISFIRQNKEIDDYAKNLYAQLFNRKYFKSLWKTVFDFEARIKEPVRQDNLILAVGEYRNQIKGLEQLEARIASASSGRLNEGDFYIAVAEFKPFVPMAGKSIYIQLNEHTGRRFEDIFHSNIFSKPYKELPHVFVKDNQVKEALLDVLNNVNY